MDSDSGVDDTIVVVGEGSATVTPESAVLQVGLELQAGSAAEALGLVTSRAEAVIAAAKGRGVPEGDITTKDVTLRPQMDDHGRRVVGHLASYSLSICLADLGAAPAVIDAVSSAAGDALRLGGFRFSVPRTSPAHNEAAALAVENARSKAERLAAAAGVRLGPVLGIKALGAIGPPSPQRFAMRAARAAVVPSAAVPMEAGSDEVVERVRVTFGIADVTD